LSLQDVAVLLTSQGRVAMFLRCDVIFYHHFARNLLLSPSVKEFWKLVNIWQS